MRVDTYVLGILDMKIVLIRMLLVWLTK